MANPAELLFELLKSWNNESKTAQSSRKDESLAQHRLAVRYLNSLEEIIKTLKLNGIRVGAFEREITTWSKIVFCYPYGWTSNSSGSIPQDSLDKLENLIGYADQVVLKPDVQNLDKLFKYLDWVEETANNDDTLTPFMKSQLLTTVAHVRYCASSPETASDFDFQAAVEKLLVNLIATEKASKKEEKWATWKEHFVWPFCYDAAKFGISTVAALALNSEIAPILQALTN